MGMAGGRDPERHPLRAIAVAARLVSMPALPTLTASVLVVDGHPALRAGLAHLLGAEPGFELIGALADEGELPAVLARERPDVVVLGRSLVRADGLAACLRLKQHPDAPGVVLYSAFADELFSVPARIAQADAVVAKDASVDVLLQTLRAVADGEVRMPAPNPEAMHAASSRLRTEDLPIVGMLVARARIDEIATTLGVKAGEVWSRALRILGELGAAVRPFVSPPYTR
jgi:DNA-binding NarL/FixJ family response regulator